jgi:hypothetical protein
MAQFLAYSIKQHAEHPNTTRQYTRASKPLIAAFGAKKLSEIQPADVERYKMARSKAGTRGRPLKPATVNADLAALRVMFSYFICAFSPSRVSMYFRSTAIRRSRWATWTMNIGRR